MKVQTSNNQPGPDTKGHTNNRPQESAGGAQMDEKAQRDINPHPEGLKPGKRQTGTPEGRKKQQDHHRKPQEDAGATKKAQGVQTYHQGQTRARMGGINAKETERKGQTHPQGAEIDRTGP